MFIGGENEPRPPILQTMIKQTLTKSVVVKVNGSWKKTCQDVVAPINSWKRINEAIDAILDQSIEDYGILHKPFAPVIL